MFTAPSFCLAAGIERSIYQSFLPDDYKACSVRYRQAYDYLERLMQEETGCACVALTAVQQILTAMRAEMQPFPHITVNAPQLENIAFPKAFTQAVERKEIAREDALTQQNVLDRQRLQAQEKVNTAKADAEAKRLAADAEAYRVTTEATAEAEAIRMINAELARSPNYIQLTVAKSWDGTLPSTVFGTGDSAIPMLQLPQPGADRQRQQALDLGSSGTPANRQLTPDDDKP